MVISTIKIQGAAVAARRDPGTSLVLLEYQPRVAGGLLWEVTYRDSYGCSEGLTSEVFWGESKEGAFYRAPQHGAPYRADRVAPRFDRDPIGWSAAQIAAATQWAASLCDDA